jgi:hypothetical protein
MLNNFSGNTVYRRVLITIFCLLCSGIASAESHDKTHVDGASNADAILNNVKPWGVSLVLSQGVIKVDSMFVDEDEDLTTDVRDIIVNGYYELGDRLRLASQLQYRELGTLDDQGGFNFDYLFLDWRFYSTWKDSVGLRVGRIKNILGIYNDSRDIAFARPSIFLPQSMYSDALRDQYLRFDGAEIYGEHLLSSVDFHWTLAMGQTDYDDQVVEHLTGDFYQGDIENDKNIRASIEIILPWQLSLFTSYSFIEYTLDDNSFYYIPGGAEVETYKLGVQWQFQEWELTGEYSAVETQLKDTQADIITVNSFAQGDLHQDSESYYLQLGYSLNEQWSLLARYDMVYLDKDDKYGRATPISIYDVRKGANSYARDRTIAISWQPVSEWLLSLEYHYVRGYAWVPPLFSSVSDEGDDKNWSMVAAQVAYRFDW